MLIIHKGWLLLCSGCRTFYWLLSITCIPFTFLLQEQVLTVLFINLYYLYCLSIFQRTCRFRFKSGCKGKRFIFNYQTFSEVFFIFFLFYSFLRLSCERERIITKGKKQNRSLCESDCKDKNFYLYVPNFFGTFLFLSSSGPTLCH